MIQKPLGCLLMLLLFLTGLVCPVLGAEVESGSVYCFSTEDFAGEEALTGICMREIPAGGELLLGNRVICPGDLLTAEQLAQLTFCPRRTETDTAVQVGYLPISSHGVEAPAQLTIGIRGKEDKAPIAEDSAAETYKNLPITGTLKVSDPENQPMTFALTRQPKRGTVVLGEDGSFTYTPRKNKVGLDSFRFTATDPAGKVSREATVTVTILKPTDAAQYTDTLGREGRFAAEWMKNTGIFTGETLAGQPCFQPDKAVTRGEFVAMLVKALDIPMEENVTHTGCTDEIPRWLQPYLAAAVRSGLTEGLPEQEVFGARMPISGGEAAVLLGNALNLTASPTAMAEDAGWAFPALTALAEQGLALEEAMPLTREEAALALYRSAEILKQNEENRFEPEV